MPDQETPIVAPLETPTRPASKLPQLLLGLAVIILGSISGYFLARPAAFSSSGSDSAAPTAATINTETEKGSTNEVFSDTATGTLEEGGLNGEGTHHLVRPGGVSQTVYLVSSVIDLNEMVGKKVEVYGQTLRAQKVGWLMDVGRVKVLE